MKKNDGTAFIVITSIVAVAIVAWILGMQPSRQAIVIGIVAEPFGRQAFTDFPVQGNCQIKGWFYPDPLPGGYITQTTRNNVYGDQCATGDHIVMYACQDNTGIPLTSCTQLFTNPYRKESRIDRINLLLECGGGCYNQAWYNNAIQGRYVGYYCADCTSPATHTYTCSDSDEGPNDIYIQRGARITDETGSSTYYFDTCIDANTLNESECSGALTPLGQPGSRRVECTNGCTDGKCNSAPGCTSTCEPYAQECVSTTQVRACTQIDGCWTWTTPLMCPPNEVCENNNCVNGSTFQACIPYETRCVSTTNVQMCNIDQQGNTYWSEPIACATGLSCSTQGPREAGCGGTCTVGEQECTSNETYHTCRTDQTWSWIVRCPAATVCTSGPGYVVNGSELAGIRCWLDNTSVNPCLLGTRACTSSSHYKICGQYDADPEYEWSTDKGCPAGKTCTGPGECSGTDMKSCYKCCAGDYCPAITVPKDIECGQGQAADYPLGRLETCPEGPTTCYACGSNNVPLSQGGYPEGYKCSDNQNYPYTAEQVVQGICKGPAIPWWAWLGGSITIIGVIIIGITMAKKKR